MGPLVRLINSIEENGRNITYKICTNSSNVSVGLRDTLFFTLLSAASSHLSVWGNQCSSDGVLAENVIILSLVAFVSDQLTLNKFIPLAKLPLNLISLRFGIRLTTT